MSDVETIAEVLAAHRPYADQTAVEDGTCLAPGCGFEGDGEPESFAAHQAEMVAAALEPVIQEREKAAVNAHATATANSYMGEWPYMRQRWGTDAESEAARGIAFRTMRWLTELAARANQ